MSTPCPGPRSASVEEVPGQKICCWFVLQTSPQPLVGGACPDDAKSVPAGSDYRGRLVFRITEVVGGVFPGGVRITKV